VNNPLVLIAKVPAALCLWQMSTICEFLFIMANREEALRGKDVARRVDRGDLI